MSKCASLVPVLCLVACTGSDEPPPGDEVVSTEWESVETTFDDGAILIQKVSYRSGGLRIFGQVCRPVGTGPFPLIVANHDGFIGLASWNGGACGDAARDGYVQIESSYRGQDGSDGVIELCRGEVDDVLRMLEIALAMPEVDPARVAMWGVSHGGCVTTRAIQRGAPVTTAASVAGISNMRTAYELWRGQLDMDTTGAYQMLIDLAHAGIGGPPEDYPEEYWLRSPIEHTDTLPAELPFLISHNVEDPLVPPTQSCELARRLGVAGHHFDAQHRLLETPPPGCESAWLSSAAPVTDWSQTRYLLVYDALKRIRRDAMDTDLQGFLRAKLQPPL